MQILHTSPRIYVYIYLYLYIYIFIYISIYPSIFLSICIYILLNTTLTADYRRNKNLKDNFVRAKMTEASLKNDSLNFRINNCNSKTYSWCKILVESKTFKGNTDNKVFKIQHNIVCHSNWLKYLCECKLWGKQYVGKSEAKLYITLNNNRNHNNTGPCMFICRGTYPRKPISISMTSFHPGTKRRREML